MHKQLPPDVIVSLVASTFTQNHASIIITKPYSKTTGVLVRTEERSEGWGEEERHEREGERGKSEKGEKGSSGDSNRRGGPG